MKNIKKYAIPVALLAMVAMVGVASATEPTYPELVGTTIDGVLDDIAEVLFDNLPTFLGLVAALIGLFFVIRLIRRWIGRNK